MRKPRFCNENTINKMVFDHWFFVSNGYTKLFLKMNVMERRKLYKDQKELFSILYKMVKNKNILDSDIKQQLHFILNIILFQGTKAEQYYIQNEHQSQVICSGGKLKIFGDYHEAETYIERYCSVPDDWAIIKIS